MTTTLVNSNESLMDAVRAVATSDDCELPMLPEVSAELLRLTNDVDCEASDIVALIKRDQSLTTHLLRIANSVRYNTGVTVSSIQQAVARLGLISVREITVLISCQCRIFDVPGFEKDVRISFRRSLATGAFCQEIARVRRMNVEEAFLSGLLHDVGRPILFQALADRRKKQGLNATDAEIIQAADDHRVILAARLIGAWGMTDRVAEAVQYQLNPEQAPNSVLQAAAVRLAMDLALNALDPNAMAFDESNPHPMLAVLGLYSEQFNTIARHRDEILEWVNSTT